MTNASAPSTQLTGAEPRYWPCGTCRAESGEMCRTITGNPAPSHIDRHRSVARFMRYGIVRAGV
jgi:hypothetical protein